MAVRRPLVVITGELQELPFGDSLVGVTQQNAYDNTGGVPHIALASGQPFTLRDNATPIGDVLVCEDSAGIDFFNVDPAQLDFGQAGNRSFEFSATTIGKGGIRYIPDGRTLTSTVSQAALQWDSLVISNVPGGAPFGNDTAPAMVASTGECRFDDNAFVFATSLLFNQATIISANVGSLGPIYTLVHQPTIRSVSAGAKTCSQMNAVRAQPKIGPNTAGSITQSSISLFYAYCRVDATGGFASSVTDCVYFQALNPLLTAGGTMGTLSVLRIENLTSPTTAYGIDSAMSAGTFIRHTGTAPSTFAGALHMNNAVALNLGTVGGSLVALSRPSAGVMRMIGSGGVNNEGLDWDFQSVTNNVIVSSTTGAALRLNARLDINNGIALGGGATATLGTIGGSGPTAAAQAQWVEIDINGTPHWIPVWT